MRYFYSHGFHSGRDCETYKRLCLGLNINPSQLIYDNGGMFMENLLSLKQQLLAMLKSDKSPFSFIGNSLGAFYLWQLCNFAKDIYVPLPKNLILFNPVIFPLSQLHKAINLPHKNHTTQKRFSFSRTIWGSYESAMINLPPLDVHLIICLANNDEIINSKDSKAFFTKNKHSNMSIVDFNGTHHIKDFAPFKYLITKD